MEKSLRERIEFLLRVSPLAKPRVYVTVFRGSDVVSLSYALELTFSAGIATLGLVLNSPAVVIGAMLISPLMGPIMGAGLGLAVSDLYLGAKAFAGIVASVLASILFSAFLVWLLPFHGPLAEFLPARSPISWILALPCFPAWPAPSSSAAAARAAASRPCRVSPLPWL